MQKKNIIGLIIGGVIIVIGAGLFFWQQSSIKTLRREVQILQKNNENKSAQLEDNSNVGKNESNGSKEMIESSGNIVNNSSGYDSNNTTKKIKKNEQVVSSESPKKEVENGNDKNKVVLPTGVEWLTYKDNNISFIYPKTFLGTPLQESQDENLSRKKWEIFKDDDTIYIRPNFESPVAEFGSTYEIQIMRNLKEAQNLFHSILFSGSSKNLCSQHISTQLSGYTACSFERDFDAGLGRVGKYYVIMPNSKSGMGKLPWIYVFDISGGKYTNYVKNILLPSISFIK